MTVTEILTAYSVWLQEEGIDLTDASFNQYPPENFVKEFLGTLTDDSPPPCDNHHEVQHRDRQGPWCNQCGWSHGTAIRLPFRGERDPNADPS